MFFKKINLLGGLYFRLLVPVFIVFFLSAIFLYQFIPVLIDTNAFSSRELANKIIIILLVIIILMALITAFTFHNKITRPLAIAAKVAKKISDGDLTTDGYVLPNDEIGKLNESLNLVKTRLANVISSIRAGSNAVSQATNQVSQGNSNLSQRAQVQASSLEEVVSAMEEMTVTVNQNAGNALKAKELVVDANERAKRSLVVASTAIGAMAKIETSSNEIADIVNVIEKIAFQTKLLALNATVEAARAGEQGRGFSVVASEVRVLAGRSAKAAKEIKELINDSVSDVEEGSGLIDDTAVALSEINSAVQNVSELVAEIAAASKEQSAGITQVNRALVQMDDVMQQNASLVDEASAASEAMGAQAKELNTLVEYFKVKEGDARPVRTIKRVHVSQDKEPIHKVKDDIVKSKSLPPIVKKRAIHEDEEWQEF